MIKVELKGSELSLIVSGNTVTLANELHALAEKLNESCAEEHPEAVATLVAAFITGFGEKTLDTMIENFEDLIQIVKADDEQAPDKGGMS